MSQDNLKECGLKRKLCSSQESESQMKWYRRKIRKLPRRRSRKQGPIRDKILLSFSLQLNTLINYPWDGKGSGIHVSTL